MGFGGPCMGGMGGIPPIPPPPCAGGMGDPRGSKTARYERSEPHKNNLPPSGNRFMPGERRLTTLKYPENDILRSFAGFLSFRCCKWDGKGQDVELGIVVAPMAVIAVELEYMALDPNVLFMDCCEQRGLPDACLRHCTYNTFRKDSLIRMYFKQDACPIHATAEIQFCAAQGRDHRACCQRNGVTTTLAGAKCLTFCDQRPGNVTMLDMSYVPCYERFENMKACFWHDTVNRLKK
ncbi:DB module [Teladorsagia circumcincta]|uniref:DB module n=1 Tax=Teladorsagia circumcincta TaxID=45464 RepID=A0A2G9UPK1_TELCI|nr:DB module [Teladorsagia circumcincta]